MKQFAVVVEWNDNTFSTYFYDDLIKAESERDTFRKHGHEATLYSKIESAEGENHDRDL